WANRPGGGGHAGHGGNPAHGAAHPVLPTPAEDVAELALDPAAWEVVLEEVRPREAVGPDGIQTATLKDGVVLYRRRS
ncbi:MAG: hypothetical protein Q7T31_16115, partial [Dietzia sp.]|nr:hypothetical protein [Dietzia sp.]